MRRRPVQVLVILALTVLGLLSTAAAPSMADKGSGGGDGGGGSSRPVGDRTPLFDFTDAFYRSNGVDPAALVGRRSGQDGISVVAASPDGDHRDVRSKLTLPAYDLSGNRWFFTVMADLGPNAFTKNSAGAAAQKLAEASPVYVFPTTTGDPLAVSNNRQADMVDLSHGYFSNNKLALWVHIFVTWTDKAFTTSAGKQTLASLLAKNGAALDGTPIIKTESELKSLTSAGLVKQTKRGTDQAGRYFVCPVFKDPRRGAITSDAFLATVRRADGTALPAEQSFVDDFTSLQTTGEYPNH